MERKLELVKNHTVEETIQEIELPLLDFTIHEEDETWFQEALKQLEDRKIN